MDYPYGTRRSRAPLLLLLFFGVASGFFVCLVIGIGAGIALDRSGLLSGPSTSPPSQLGHTFDPFWQAWNLVEEHYVDREAVQPKRMTEGAISGMLATLGDVGHTTYVTADEYRQLESGLRGQLEGIGARMTIRKGRPIIVQVLAHSPARASGLKAGDALLEVDGKPVGNLSLQQIVERVRGPAGTTVRLRVMPVGATSPTDLEIPRARVEVPDISWQMLPGVPFAHLVIQDFGKETDAQLRDILEQARMRGAQKVIVDVRGNRGGLKEQAVAVTSEFLDGGVVFIEQDATGARKEVPVTSGGRATAIPLCVLIDEGTASSAEIFAGAIQDYHRAKLVGATTFGTGTVLQPFRLLDGSAVLLAVAEWLTPKGRQIWHHGISPDIPVAMPEDATAILPDDEKPLDAATLAHSGDKQLLAAIELLRK